MCVHFLQVFVFRKISLFREEALNVRSNSSLLSSLYGYWTSSETTASAPSVASGGGAGGRGLSASEGKARSAAMACIEVGRRVI